MSSDDHRATMEAYLDALISRGDYARYLAPEVVVELVGTEFTAQGREDARTFIDHLHRIAFDARPEIRSLTIADGRAALEAVFVGQHIGEFVDQAPTGRTVRVDYTVVYELGDGLIKALRIHFPLERLIAQIAGGPPAAAA